MKVRVKTTAAVALLAAIAGTASFAAPVTYVAGDLIIGFQGTNTEEPGSDRNFLYNIGSAADYNTGAIQLGFESPIANIGDALSSIYGAQWFGRTDLKWGAAGLRETIAGRGPTGEIIKGDGAGVLYVSKATTGIGESTPWDAISRNQGARNSTSAYSLLAQNAGGSFNSLEAYTADGFGASGSVTDSNSWSNANKGNYTFEYFQGTIQGSAQLAEVVIDPETFESSLVPVAEYVYLDIYRTTPDGQTPTWVMTLALDADGNVYAVPEPSTYAALIGIAGFALVLARRSRRNKAAA